MDESTQLSYAPVERTALNPLAGDRVPARLTKSPQQNSGWTSVGGQTVRVGPEENVYTLSYKYNVPVDALMMVNRVTVPSAIQPNDTIVIPVRAEPKAPVYNANSEGRVVRNAPHIPKTASAPLQAQILPEQTKSSANEVDVAVVTLPPAPIGGARPIVTDSIPQTTPVYVRPAAVQTKQLPVYDGLRQNAVRITPSAKPKKQVSLGTQQLAFVSLLPQPKSISYDTSPIIAVPVSEVTQTTAPTPLATHSTPEVIVTEKPQSETVKEVVVASIEPKAPILAQEAKKSEDLNTTNTSKGEKYFRWPVRGRIISEFGPKPGGSKNDGINLAVPEGTQVKAVEAGSIVYAGNELKGFGNLILIRHADGWVSAYAHNKDLSVRRGDIVKRGQVIATTGATGSVTQPQLHFELRKDNRPVDPMLHLPQS
ncbi:peptidoglycan DD-metalloendopeptidase family protein [Flexibacterium corallicola]|uniref:peptidoglycan DD-metalloendopeptidase family protein n=1 Tax=Flexibacterium corallicola TaxID=3037259 RepID=UPI00286F4F75|nr:peptidoglycan DD-metalloendopeptidase family protein [Pseudovibrio sp. M1P-2-3]